MLPHQYQLGRPTRETGRESPWGIPLVHSPLQNSHSACPSPHFSAHLWTFFKHLLTQSSLPATTLLVGRHFRESERASSCFNRLTPPDLSFGSYNTLRTDVSQPLGTPAPMLRHPQGEHLGLCNQSQTASSISDHGAHPPAIAVASLQALEGGSDLIPAKRFLLPAKRALRPQPLLPRPEPLAPD